MSTFKFKASGKTPEGATFKLSGEVKADDALAASAKAASLVREVCKCDADKIDVRQKEKAAPVVPKHKRLLGPKLKTLTN